MNRKSETEEVLDENEQDRNMKTIFIWSEFENLPKFFILDGDYSHLDGTIINTKDSDENNVAELHCLYWDFEKEKKAVELLDKFPLHVLDNEGETVVINVGFAQ